jgi:hypothetical protein
MKSRGARKVKTSLAGFFPHANPSTGIVVQKENPQSLAFAVGLLLPCAQQKTMFGKA